MTRAFLAALLLAAPLLAALVAPPAAHAADLTVTGAFGRATPGTATPGAAYLVIHGGDAPDRLVGVTSPRGDVQMHSMDMQGDVMRMREIDGIAIPANGTVTLAPGGLHLMVMGLKAPLKEGETLPLTLRFEHAGLREVAAPIAARAATAPPPMH